MPTVYNNKQRSILNRSENNKTASNYSDALDSNISQIRDKITQVADHYTYLLDNNKKVPGFLKILYNLNNKKIPTGMSNCTLTATQWVNPKEPLMRAQTIIDNGENYGYIEVPEKYAIPGDLVIATNPNNNAHHTMLIHDFTKVPENHFSQGKQYNLPAGHPLVRYSSGTTNASGYRKSVGLLEYLNNSDGKTKIQYYRHYNPGEYEVLLPEVIVTPNNTSVSKDNIKINHRIKTKLQNNFKL